MKIDFEVPRNKINKICIIRNVGRILGAQNNFPFKYTCAVDKSMEAIRISKIQKRHTRLGQIIAVYTSRTSQGSIAVYVPKELLCTQSDFMYPNQVITYFMYPMRICEGGFVNLYHFFLNKNTVLFILKQKLIGYIKIFRVHKLQQSPSQGGGSRKLDNFSLICIFP